MNMDINVKKIVNVYYYETDRWKRDFYAPRIFDAIVLFTDGEIEYHFNGKTVVAKKGELLYLPGNIPYSGKKHTEKVSFFVLDFLCDAENDFEKLGAPFVASPENYDVVFSKFSKAVFHWNKREIDVNLQMKSFVYSLLCEVYKQINSENNTTPVGDILEYIVDNLGNKSLNISYLCNKFYISESQLRRNILKATGYKPNEYILTLRINSAKNELIYSYKSIKQISDECGFSSPYYFSRCFSKCTKASPKEFKKRYGEV